jgi:hypothetical protein
MRQETDHRHDARLTAAVEELKTLIAGRYPTAAFDLSQGDDPEGVYLTTTVDIDDPDEVTDLVIDRTMRLQIDEQLPVYVVPIRPISRVMDDRRRRFEHGTPLPSTP